MVAVEHKWPDVSVVIVNYNGAAHLHRCLTALLGQSVVPHEIILVDNGSSDSSLEIVTQFPTVRVLAQAENLGFSKANNLAIQVAANTSEWIALVNTDAFVDPTWLETLLTATQQFPETAAFGSRLLAATDPKLLDGVGDAYYLSGRVSRKGYGCPAEMATDRPSEIFSACAAAALYQRSALNDVGGFDEDYFCYVEDVDLGFRLRLAGYSCLYIPTAVSLHVGYSTSGGRHSDFSVYHSHRNLVWTYLKNMPGWLLWISLPMHLLLNLVTLILFTWRGQLAIVLQAKWDALKGLPDMWQKRQVIQSKRRVSVSALLKVMQKRV